MRVLIIRYRKRVEQDDRNWGTEMEWASLSHFELKKWFHAWKRLAGERRHVDKIRGEGGGGGFSLCILLDSSWSLPTEIDKEMVFSNTISSRHWSIVFRLIFHMSKTIQKRAWSIGPRRWFFFFTRFFLGLSLSLWRMHRGIIDFFAPVNIIKPERSSIYWSLMSAVCFSVSCLHSEQCFRSAAVYDLAHDWHGC